MNERKATNSKPISKLILTDKKHLSIFPKELIEKAKNILSAYCKKPLTDDECSEMLYRLTMLELKLREIKKKINK